MMMTKSRKQRAQKRKAFALLGDITIGTAFELTGESGSWVKMDIAADDLVPIGRLGTFAISRQLPENTTVIVEI